MENDTQQPIRFEELFDLPQNIQELKAIDLQGVQRQLGLFITYIEETRSVHDASYTTVETLLADLKAAQQAFRHAEVDHVTQTQEIADEDSGEIHDIISKEGNEDIFSELLNTYVSAVSGLKTYVDDTIVALHAAGKLTV